MAATVDSQQMFYLVRPNKAELNPYGAGSGQRRSCAAYIDAGHLQDTDFFFVPHAFMGQALLWDMPTAHGDPVAYRVLRLTQLAEGRADADLRPPDDEWDAATQAPFRQLDPVNRPELQYATWLVAYPHYLDHSRFVAALDEPGEEGGAWLMPIDSDSLAAVADAVWYGDQRDLTLLERLKELLLPPTGGGPSIIERTLDRTGTWLAHNPVLAHDAKSVNRCRPSRPLYVVLWAASSHGDTHRESTVEHRAARRAGQDQTISELLHARLPVERNCRLARAPGGGCRCLFMQSTIPEPELSVAT